MMPAGDPSPRRSPSATSCPIRPAGASARSPRASPPGSLLVIVTDTMLSEAYDVDQIWERAFVTIGIAISLMLSAI